MTHKTKRSVTCYDLTTESMRSACSRLQSFPYPLSRMSTTWRIIDPTAPELVESHRSSSSA